MSDTGAEAKPTTAGTDSDAVAALMNCLKSHSGVLLAYINRQLPQDVREWAEPQDVLQDVCFEAFRGVSGFPAAEGDRRIRWLMTLAHNQIMDLIRYRRAAKRSGGVGGKVPDSDDSLVALLGEWAVYTRTPSRSAAAREFLVALDAALDRLNPDHAKVIRCRHLEGISVREIAGRMGRTEKAVEALYTRGLAALRVEMRSVSLFV
jgi:RNA polymerase sigma-70 factor (ECF subfamily)